MKIGITGATGFIGTRIIGLAREKGHAMVGFTRDPSRTVPDCIETRKFSHGEKPNIEGCDAIIHLAGEPVFGLWTRAKRRRIRESRILGTRRIMEAIASSPKPPHTLISGSAIGYYGDTGDTEVDESSPQGTGFLAEVVKEWENEALHSPLTSGRANQPLPTLTNPLRIVTLRTSIVLGPDHGALRPMLPIFRAGLGGPLGSGRQWMSWIHIDDQAALTLFALENNSITGPLNAAAPHPIRNSDFTKSLARALHRPAL
ncbi:MAG: TIGR01777 family oxidoreductase, partial [Chthoniobacteraceae bacterium]